MTRTRRYSLVDAVILLSINFGSGWFYSGSVRLTYLNGAGDANPDRMINVKSENQGSYPSGSINANFDFFFPVYIE